MASDGRCAGSRHLCPTLTCAVREDATLFVDDTVLDAAATGLMAMTNIYYRALHMAANADLAGRPSGLRMNALARPSVPPADFDLFGLAASVVNGWECCTKAHVASSQTWGHDRGNPHGHPHRCRGACGKTEDRVLFNQPSQHWNHSHFWLGMKKQCGGNIPGALKKQIVADFGSVERFMQEFMAACIAQFGSGWAWPVFNAEKLAITRTGNADTPLTDVPAALLTCDVWALS